MSVNTLIFIPEDPTALPGRGLAEQAKALLSLYLPQAEVEVHVTENVEFIATGGNLETIVCPYCHAVLDEQWWIAAMDAAYEQSRFADLTILLPCCGKVGSLNTLIYELSTGFARFQLMARDPGNDLAEEAFQELEKTLACPLRKIWAHF